MFVVFEGVDGSGKTTIINEVVKYFKSKVSMEDQVAATREPGGNDISEQIREIILSKSNTKITPMTEMLLFAASRSQFITDTLKPLLNKKKLVISDRYYYSSLIYQGVLHNIYEPTLATNLFATEGVEADITFFIDVPYNEIKRRLECRSQSNRLDCMGDWYYEKIIEGYWNLSENMVVIDGDREISKIVKDVIEIIEREMEFVEKKMKRTIDTSKTHSGVQKVPYLK